MLTYKVLSTCIALHASHCLYIIKTEMNIVQNSGVLLQKFKN